LFEVVEGGEPGVYGGLDVLQVGYLVVESRDGVDV
jgi:hypothetical protein